MERSSISDLQRIIEEGIVRSVDGVDYSAHKMIPIHDNTVVSTIVLGTLTSLIDYLLAAPIIDDLDKSKVIIIIDDERTVRIVSSLRQPAKIRDTYASAVLSNDYDKFPFGQFMNHEDFIIKLKSLFVDSEDQQAVLKYVSSLTIKGSIETLDDGVSQSATTKKGVSGAFSENKAAPSIVTLSPYRTFREVGQPMSRFLFRMRTAHNDGGAPLCALIEADGGVWRHQAVKLIGTFLTAKLPGVTILS